MPGLSGCGVVFVDLARFSLQVAETGDVIYLGQSFSHFIGKVSALVCHFSQFEGRFRTG